jgi:predicted dehydrogenase
MTKHPQVIVVGAGNWGKNLVKNFYDLEALAGIAELNPVLRSNVAILYPDIPIYSEFATALNSNVQAIVIATPAPSHYELAIAALKSGKDVFIEKPMTLDAKQARELASYADHADRILMVGHLLLYQPAIAWLRDYLASGEAGEVLHISTQRTKLGKVRAEENVWWSFAPHDVSVILSLFGNPAVKTVRASGHAMLQPHIADYAHVDLEFETGQTAHIHCSWYYPILQRQTIAIATKQMLIYDEVAQTVTIHHKTVDRNLQNHDQGTHTVEIANTEPLKLECQHFLECLRNRQRPRSDGWNGVAVVEILEKAQEDLND